eukprot:4568130-Lingulodinium_polyedra.AAC.1
MGTDGRLQSVELVDGDAVAEDVHHPHGIGRHVHRVAEQCPALRVAPQVEQGLQGRADAVAALLW